MSGAINLVSIFLVFLFSRTSHLNRYVRTWDFEFLVLFNIFLFAIFLEFFLSFFWVLLSENVLFPKESVVPSPCLKHVSGKASRYLRKKRTILRDFKMSFFSTIRRTPYAFIYFFRSILRNDIFSKTS